MTGRIRTLKPEWLEDELLAAASDSARMLSAALMLMADDYGRGRGSIATVAAEAWRFELERDDGAHARECLAKVSRVLQELCGIRFVLLYEVDGQRYFAIRTWKRHQKVDHPSKPRIPEPDPKEWAAFCNSRESLREPSRESRETLGEVSETLAPDLYLRPVPVPPTADPGGGGFADHNPEADYTWNRRAMERTVSDVRGKPWTVPTQRFGAAAKADEVADAIRDEAAVRKMPAADLCAWAFERWLAERQASKRSAEPHVWLEDWAGALPPPAKKKEPWRDLEG